MKKIRLILITFLLILLLPYIGSYLKFGHAPPGYGLFPAQEQTEDPDPGFNLYVFIGFAVVELFVYAFLIFPSLFGFKKLPKSDTPDTPTVSVGYPSWFMPGLITMLISWAFMWGRFSFNINLDHFSFVPLWWGFIFVLDGFVYKRNNGKSLIATKPNTMKLLAVASAFSWFVFEFLNFFVLTNWYYPNGDIMNNKSIFSNFGNIAWQLLSYTTVLPAIFEWYFLLKTFKFMRERYLNGPKVVFSRSMEWIFLVLGLALMILMGYFPHELFWVLWVSLIPALIPAMTISKRWTPLLPIANKGDWSYLNLIAIATLINGFFWELWNFGSEWFHNYAPTNPNYWKYSVPYVDVIHIFSEMPLMGYCGYLLFGVVCWVLWLAVAYICDFDHDISLDDEPQRYK